MKSLHEVRKLSLGKQECATQQWLIVHFEQLNNMIKIYIDPQNQGFCTSLLLKCSLCKRDGYRKSIFTSPQLQDVSRNYVAFDVNVCMVLLAHKLGLGYAALKKISKVLGIPGLHLITYQKHD